MSTIQWYPGHMEKTKRQIKEKLGLVDVVYELLDARAPEASRNPMIDELVKNKPRLILLNKSDLADKKALKYWTQHFEDAHVKVLAINAVKGKNLEKIVLLSEHLAKKVLDREHKQGRLKRPIRAMILGIPNVGKSTLINQLVSRRVTRVGDTPGITKAFQMIRIHESLELLDTPGILWPKFESRETALKLALLGTIKDHLLPLDDVVIYGFKYLSDYRKAAFETRYDIRVDIENIVKIFDDIGIKRGCLKKGGTVDYDRVIDLFLHDFRQGAFGGIDLDAGGR